MKIFSATNFNYLMNKKSAIDWFRTIKNEHQYSLIFFDIIEFYPFYRPEPPEKALSFVPNYDEIAGNEKTSGL